MELMLTVIHGAFLLLWLVGMIMSFKNGDVKLGVNFAVFALFEFVTTAYFAYHTR